VRYNDPAFLEEVIGMPEAHKRAFLTVAKSERCVIIVRATGPTCHGLLEEGYDTKGYRIHGKSCDWGPMAGFVVRDPRLNKYGMAKARFNREKHTESINLDAEGQGWKASTTPLVISQRRVDWLKEKHLIQVTERGDRLDGQASHPSGIVFNYSLIKRTDDPTLYGVYFNNSGNIKFVQERGSGTVFYHQKWGSSYETMLAMTNPPGYGIMGVHERFKAITGDYDLFAVWPFKGSYNAGAYGDDHRPLGTVRGSVGKAERENVEHLERNFTVGGQGTKLGNITPRIYMVCQMINSIIGRHVLWHSDEAARPFLDDVDLPVLAMTPLGNYFGIENIFDFKVFIEFCDREGIHVSLSNAWAQDATAKHPNRLGAEFSRYVPADGKRIIVPNWYNG
jgi:hypothetical protein